MFILSKLDCDWLPLIRVADFQLKFCKLAGPGSCSTESQSGQSLVVMRFPGLSLKLPEKRMDF